MSAMNPTSTASQPIGVFDSGLGGLTVLKDLLQHFPHEDFIYLGDTARVPYGNKSPENLTRYSQQNIDFLVKQGVKSIVIACNSASTMIERLTSPVPLFEVITPAAQEAQKSTQNRRIGVIATRATVTQKSYVHKIQNLAADIQVFQQACPLLVPFVEEGWHDDPLTNLVVYRYLQPIVKTGIDTLILGCTHYPLLLKTLRNITGSNIHIIRSGPPLCEHLKTSSDFLWNNQPGSGQIRLFTTDRSPLYASLIMRILRPLPMIEIEHVNLEA